MKKNKNPLYVVTNDGKDVLEASGLLDAMLKKLGLEPMLAQLDTLLKMLVGMVSSYAVFTVVKEWLDQFVATLESLIKKVDPVLAFSLFN